MQESKDLSRDKNIVFEVGLPKTGTSSLREYFRLCEYTIVPDALCADPIIEAIKENDNVFAGEFGVTAMVRFGNLANMFPKAKFILTTRDPTDWYKSFHNHFFKTRPCADPTLGLLCSLFFSERLPLEGAAIHGYNRHLEWFREFSESRELAKTEVNSLNRDTLELEITDPVKKEKLRDFVTMNKGIWHDSPYPCENKGDYEYEKVLEEI